VSIVIKTGEGVRPGVLLELLDLAQPSTTI